MIKRTKTKKETRFVFLSENKKHAGPFFEPRASGDGTPGILKLFKVISKLPLSATSVGSDSLFLRKLEIKITILRTVGGARVACPLRQRRARDPATGGTRSRNKGRLGGSPRFPVDLLTSLSDPPRTKKIRSDRYMVLTTSFSLSSLGSAPLVNQTDFLDTQCDLGG